MTAHASGQQRSPAAKSHAGRLFLRVALLLTVLLLLVQWLYMGTAISGNSMNPTLRDGGWAIVFTQAYRFHPPQRGDLVMVSTGADLIIKRVIGLPGETVAIHESHVLINKELLPEPYVKQSGHWEVQPGEIGAGRYAIVGDNRSGSQTNALLAVVRQERILGKLVYY